MRPPSTLLLLALSVSACSLRIPSKPLCGDGELHFGEDCDDANNLDGDGCSATCKLEDAVCGNGVLEADEACDDNNVTDGDGCSSFCRLELASCGDGVLDPGEQCDDGPANSNTLPDACRLDCFFFICGDNIVDSDEACDDGNSLDADGCEADCSLPACSNGIVDPGEVCFDADPLRLSVLNHPRGIDIADLNQDTLPDIIVSEQGQSSPGGAFGDGINDQVLAILQTNNGFQAPSGIFVGDASRFVRAVDVDGDGNPEILATHELSNTLSLLNNQDGVFVFDSSVDVPEPAEFVLGDLDGDGSLDVAVASFAGTVELFLSSSPVPISLSVGCAVEGVDLGDVNDDGTLDVMSVCAQNLPNNQVRLFSGEEILTQRDSVVPFEILSVNVARVGRFGDFNDDGRLDIAVVERNTDSVVIFFQQPNGNGFNKKVEAVGAGIISLTIADMNRDGIADIVTTEEVDNQSTILLSNGGQNFIKQAFPVGVGPRVVAVGDLNQDTLPDFATANREDDSVTVYLSTP